MAGCTFCLPPWILILDTVFASLLEYSVHEYRRIKNSQLIVMKPITEIYWIETNVLSDEIDHVNFPIDASKRVFGTNA